MIEWQEKFSRQLKWSKKFRSFIYRNVDFNSKVNLLDIGCGTGGLLREIGKNFKLQLYGIEIDGDRLKRAENLLNESKINATLLNQDFLNNEFKDEMFDLITTHYFFLWIKDLQKAFNEIHRILKKDGILLILAEPDYGGLIENPETNLRDPLIENLKEIGADPYIGRKLNQYIWDQFKVMEYFCTSVPWISNIYKKQLLEELVFCTKMLGKDKFDTKKMKDNIDSGQYSLFIPVFSYFLQKK